MVQTSAFPLCAARGTGVGCMAIVTLGNNKLMMTTVWVSIVFVSPFCIGSVEFDDLSANQKNITAGVFPLIFEGPGFQGYPAVRRDRDAYQQGTQKLRLISGKMLCLISSFYLLKCGHWLRRGRILE